jgi:transposase
VLPAPEAALLTGGALIFQRTGLAFASPARHETDRRAAMRMIAIAETVDGADRKTAARRGDMSDQALRDAIKRYNAEGIDGQHDRPRTGRPTKLSDEHRSELRAIVVKGPDVDAEGLSAYTRDDLVQIVAAKWCVGYDPTSVGRILRWLGLSRQKARPTHPKKDTAAAEAFKKGLRTSCKKSSVNVLTSGCASSFRTKRALARKAASAIAGT